MSECQVNMTGGGTSFEIYKIFGKLKFLHWKNAIYDRSYLACIVRCKDMLWN
jgi:hypothetical protein